jgi:hypothetical protein
MLHSFVLVGSLGTGCGVDDEHLSQVESYATVSSYITSTCSTAVVLGLSKQIAQEVGCANPTGLVEVIAGGNLQITTNAVLPYLSAEGKSDLMAVAATRVVQINSAFRTVAQQYLLYEWYLQGRCGITAAATPGRSNHESGRALDLANYSVVIEDMESHGWAHDVPGDDVHFDHFASADIRGLDVAAFQRLWNKNHPEDTIAVDGQYGSMTEARLRQAPADGFPLGPECAAKRDVELVAVAGPDRVPPRQRVHYAITLVNAGTVTWPETTALRLATATSSQLYDPSWTSGTTIATLGAAVAPGETVTIDLDVTTPATDVELPIMEELALDDGGTKFGDIQLALTVVPGMGGDESGDGSETDDVEGGCNAGGGRAGAFVLLALLGMVRRRR